MAGSTGNFHHSLLSKGRRGEGRQYGPSERISSSSMGTLGHIGREARKRVPLWVQDGSHRLEVDKKMGTDGEVRGAKVCGG
jgi:hypothetical protein